MPGIDRRLNVPHTVLGLLSLLCASSPSAVAWDGVRSWGEGCYMAAGSSPTAIVQVGGSAISVVRANGAVKIWCGDQEVPLPSDLGLVRKFGSGGGSGSFAAIRQDGTVRTWIPSLPDGGANSAPSNLGPCTELTSGSSHFAAVKASGMVACWGWDYFGQCSVPADLGPCQQVAAGYSHTLALRTDGLVRGWGYPSAGELPVPSDLGPCVGIGAGPHHSIAIRADGSVRCWGANSFGQCDVPVDLAPCSQVAGGEYHTVALQQDGAVRCWGYHLACDVPPDLGPCRQVAAYGHHTIALRTPDSDIDSDLIADEEDNCPSLANPTQADCDNDGVGDACEIASGAPDVNHDGIPDHCQCLADLFIDGQVNGADLGIALSQWGHGAGAVSDINRDGIVNGADLGILLSSWGACP